jgi:hypothetical protein
VRIRQFGDGVLLESIILDTSKWFAELDRFKAEPFMKKGTRQQPMIPKREIFD